MQANLLAACTEDREALNQVYNVAVGDRTTLNELFALLRENLARLVPNFAADEPVHGPFRAGDVQHSQADIAKAVRLLGYRPSHRIGEGLAEAMPWYVRGPPRAEIASYLRSPSLQRGAERSAAAVEISGQVSVAPVPSMASMPTSTPTLASNSASARSSPGR